MQDMNTNELIISDSLVINGKETVSGVLLIRSLKCLSKSRFTNKTTTPNKKQLKFNTGCI